ncbi:acyl-CoA synthetase FdrA [Bacillus horti]|uniref:Succinyl-CoA synthetase alpha subunit n=1 Tax=Caldalkalibacillus horti TaxID=77523 RepID=A0ABT9W3B1_9BACI|nr:acyl-CoA synthetase FdrA [Bacillus horti]MDQ0167736.1 succinyl-CoA synthetase alpha subunit [Bacillus horti]
MSSKVVIKKNSYHDSVTLMSLASKALSIEGVNEAIVSMATAMNKDLIQQVGLMTEEVAQATPNDLIIAISANSEEISEQALQFIEEAFQSKQKKSKGEKNKSYQTINTALEAEGEHQIAIISVPGDFAAREANIALDKGLHVMMFSDNVSIEDEKQLKQKAVEKNLFVMGPDCGTAIINGVGLCFANNVRKGNIGLVAASGTGLQEVTVQIDRLGGGITQAFGTGGRDLYESIGGIMMKQGLKALAEDENTEVIVLISKPPAKKVQDEILELVKSINKPVVISFIDGDEQAVKEAGAYYGESLADTAYQAVKLANPTGNPPQIVSGTDEETIQHEAVRLAASQQYIRALFCGGTLCSEALSILRNAGLEVRSNVSKKDHEQLLDIKNSMGHTLLDLGEDEFTVGRPHPMIDPTIRNERIIQEARDPETAVLLLDFELGYGAHEDPIGSALEFIQRARKTAEEEGRYFPVIAYVCGTEADKQSLSESERKLKEAGVLVANSNVQAVELANQLISSKGGKA